MQTFQTMGRSWVAVEQTLKFLPLARVRNDIVYEPEASRQCHSLQEQEEEISMSARLPPRNDIVSIYVKPPLNKARKGKLNRLPIIYRCFGPLRRSRYICTYFLIYNDAFALRIHFRLFLFMAVVLRWIRLVHNHVVLDHMNTSNIKPFWLSHKAIKVLSYLSGNAMIVY